MMEEVEEVRAEVLKRRGVVGDAAAGGKKVDTEEARKRALAKARQDAIMRQMKAQQASFAFNLEEEGMDEDGEGEGEPQSRFSMREQSRSRRKETLGRKTLEKEVYKKGMERKKMKASGQQWSR